MDIFRSKKIDMFFTEKRLLIFNFFVIAAWILIAIITIFF